MKPDPLKPQVVQMPLFICGCGWTSYEGKFDLAYHAKVHKCSRTKKNG